MTGKIILAGGHEVRPGCEPMDRVVLDAAGGATARVVFVPTAVAAYDPRGSVAGAVAYFARLGATATGAMILNRADAERVEATSGLRDADLIYLGGGDPAFLLQTLHGSAAWMAIIDAYARGAVVGGSSAGAMVVCDWVALPPAWTPAKVGLGLVHDAVVLPHYTRARQHAAEAMARALPAGIAVLGIPEQSGLLGADRAWTVVGPGPVTVFTAKQVRVGLPGEEMSW